MTERILQILDLKNINKSTFYKNAGLSNGYLDKNKSFTSVNVVKILNFFPDVDANWLLTGQGTMLKTEVKSEWDCNELENLKKINELQDFKIKALENEVFDLKKLKLHEKNS